MLFLSGHRLEVCQGRVWWVKGGFQAGVGTQFPQGLAGTARVTTSAIFMSHLHWASCRIVLAILAASLPAQSISSFDS